MSPDIAELLDALVTRPSALEPLESVEGWWQAHLECAPEDLDPAHRAALGGFVCDRLGYAFAAGYTEAMRRVGNPPEPLPLRRRALCATEVGGGHPRAIETSLEPLTGTDEGRFRLSGTKTFVTLGEHAEELVVIASLGREAGLPRLVAVRVPAGTPGLELVTLPPTPFVPEIPHARAELDGVLVEASNLLAGDGYIEVLKPFRTVEDTHVFLAALGWLTRVGREANWPAATIERGLAAIAALVPLARSQVPLSPGLHRALGGALAQARAHIQALRAEDAWDHVSEEVLMCWMRDQPLLSIASKVRARRLERARSTVRA